MNTTNVSTLKIHKLTQAQYDRELAAGRIDENALYLTPDEEIDLSGYATKEELNNKANSSHTHSIANVTNLQTTLDGKQATISGGASTITSSNLTANRALISNGSGKVAVSVVTSTELGYLDGVTSNIQTQLNAKLASTDASSTYMTKSNPTGEGTLTMTGDGVFSGSVEVESLQIGGVTVNYDNTNKFLEFVFTSTTDTGTEEV